MSAFASCNRPSQFRTWDGRTEKSFFKLISWMKHSNFTCGNSFISLFVGIFEVEIHTISITLLATTSSPKCCCISISFIQICNSGLYASWIAIWLLKCKMVIGGVQKGDISISSTRLYRNRSSFVAWIAAICSSSQENKETIGCFFVDQLIMHPNT